MNREDWQKVEQKLTYPHALVALQCDGYRVDLFVYRNKMRMHILVFVDGSMSTQHVAEDSDIRRRFMRPVVRKPRAFTKKEQRSFGKRWCDKYIKDHTRMSYSHDWPNVATIRRHFSKTNASIALLPEPNVRGVERVGDAYQIVTATESTP